MMVMIVTSLLVRRLLLVGLILTAVTSAQAASAAERYLDIDDAALEKLIEKGVTVVDVRTPAEWRETGVIAGSKLITAFDSHGRFKPVFPAQIEAAAKPDQEVAIICWTGNRSAVISRALTEQAGYTRVYNVLGGIRRWIAAGRPVTPCPSC